MSIIFRSERIKRIHPNAKHNDCFVDKWDGMKEIVRLNLSLMESLAYSVGSVLTRSYFGGSWKKNA